MDDISMDMDCLKKVREEIGRGWTGPNRECEYYPCHYEGQDCTYCFCPFYPCEDTDLGEMLTGRKGNKVWGCVQCHLIHSTPACKHIASKIKELNITEPEDPKLRSVFEGTKELFLKPGKAIMVLGTTSDAGKSLTAAALCRIISRKGYSVAPMKTQNMSLNSMVTEDGSEVASIQLMQSKAARIKHPDHNINPILLKPIKGRMTQVIVNGKPFGLFGVNSYYNDFVPSAGIAAVKKSIEIMKRRYEYVVMEGAGSPAEINLYRSDIANMRAAEMADADCILVVNMKWGGGFAYLLGTTELIAENDRKRIRGMILNNVYGDTSKLADGIKKIEAETGIPVLGAVPHIDIPLPKEDSMGIRNSDASDDEKIKIAIIKLPKIANFTDLDPLYHENVSIIYASVPDDLKGADLVILPGTKDTADAISWMRSSKMDEAVGRMKGRVPVIGICGGYQLMCSLLRDPLGIESDTPFEAEGLNYFDAVTEWKKDGRRRTNDKGVFTGTGETVKGYEVRKGETVTKERPLFILETPEGPMNEGSARFDEKLFGTYMHGLFDEPAFRRYVLRLTGKYVPTEYSDMPYSIILDRTLDKLADTFERSLDMELFRKTFMDPSVTASKGGPQ